MAQFKQIWKFHYIKTFPFKAPLKIWVTHTTSIILLRLVRYLVSIDVASVCDVLWVRGLRTDVACSTVSVLLPAVVNIPLVSLYVHSDKMGFFCRAIRETASLFYNQNDTKLWSSKQNELLSSWRTWFIHQFS